MARPAFQSHSKGATGTTHICRPSTKKITADAASGGSRLARSVVSPLTYESSAGETTVRRGSCATRADAKIAGTDSDIDRPARRATILTPLSRRVGYQWAI